MSFEVFLALTAIIAVATLAGVLLVRDPSTRALIAVGGPAALAGVHALGLVRFRADDSYITYRYARNLANGFGPVWNEGERVEGYTSFLWMLLLAALHVLRIDIEVAALLLAIASMLALFVLIWRVALRLGDDGDEGDDGGALSPYVIAAGAGLLVAANTAMGVWSMSGLEVPLIGALLMALVLAYQRESRNPALFPASALVLAAAAMTRPETNVVAATTGAFFLAQAVIERDARRWRHLALFIVVFALVAGGWFLWRWSYYGWLFPNTYYAKVGPLPDMIERGWDYVWQYAWSYLLVPSLAMAALSPLLVRGGQRRDALFMLALSVVWLAAVVLEGGDAFLEGRFIAPILPVLYLAAVAGGGRAINALRSRIASASTLAASGALAVIIVGLTLFAARSSDQADGFEFDRGAIADWRVLGLWLKDNVPPDYEVAVFAAGATPYFSQAPSLDMLGLTDETIAHSEVPNFGRGFPAHEKYNIDYVLDSREPEVILIGSAASSVLSEAQVKQLTVEAGAAAPRAYTLLVEDGRTWQRYEMAAFFYGGRWFSFLVRKDVSATVNAGWTESEGLINQGRGRR